MATLERVTEELQITNATSDLILEHEVNIDQSQVMMNDKLNDVCSELIEQTRLLRELTSGAADARRNAAGENYGNNGNSNNSNNTSNTGSSDDDDDEKKEGYFAKSFNKGRKAGKQFESFTKKPEKMLKAGIETAGEYVGMVQATFKPLTDLGSKIFGTKEPKGDTSPPNADIGTDADTRNEYLEDQVNQGNETNERLGRIEDEIIKSREADGDRASAAERERRRDATRSTSVTSKVMKGGNGLPNFRGIGGAIPGAVASKSGLLSTLGGLAGDAVIAKGITTGAGSIGGAVAGKKAADKLAGDKDKAKPKDTDKPKTKKIPKIKGAGALGALLGLIGLAMTASTAAEALEAGEIDQGEFDKMLKDEGFSIAGATGGAMAGGALGGLLGSFFPGIGNAVGGILGSILGAFLGEDAVNRFKNKVTGGEGTPASATPPPPPTPEYDYPVTDYEGNVVGNFRTPEEATDYVMKNGGILGKATLVPTGAPLASVGNPTTAPANGMAELTDIMDYQQVMLDNNKEETLMGGSSLGIVNAPTSNTTQVNNTTVQGGSILVSDITDRTSNNYRSDRR